MRITIIDPTKQKPGVIETPEEVKLEAVGPRSEKVLPEVERLTQARAGQEAKVERLATEVQERQSKLDTARAAGLVDKVDAQKVGAFEKELASLQKELAKAKSALAGLKALLAEKLRELHAAQVADVEEALEVKELTEAEEGLARNAKALEKARADFLKALESGATPLVRKVRPLLEEWQELARERAHLHWQRCTVIGGDGDRQMYNDPLSKLFPEAYDGAAVLDLAEMLLPLVAMVEGWPRIRGRGPQGLPWL